MGSHGVGGEKHLKIQRSAELVDRNDLTWKQCRDQNRQQETIDFDRCRDLTLARISRHIVECWRAGTCTLKATRSDRPSMSDASGRSCLLAFWRAHACCNPLFVLQYLLYPSSHHLQNPSCLRLLRIRHHHVQPNPTTTRHSLVGEHIRCRPDQHMDIAAEAVGKARSVLPHLNHRFPQPIPLCQARYSRSPSWVSRLCSWQALLFARNSVTRSGFANSLEAL